MLQYYSYSPRDIENLSVVEFIDLEEYMHIQMDIERQRNNLYKGGNKTASFKPSYKNKVIESGEWSPK